jgi:hypothetical protein
MGFKIVYMKTKAFIFLFTVALFACNQSENNTESQSDEINSSMTDTARAFNNGVKWKADSITNHNVIQLKNTTDMFQVKPFPPLATYQLLGSDLSSDVNTMIQQCKMKGEAHEALHKWLSPILSQSNQLKSVADTAAARKIFDNVARRINAYYQYFE